MITRSILHDYFVRLFSVTLWSSMCISFRCSSFLLDYSRRSGFLSDYLVHNSLSITGNFAAIHMHPLDALASSVITRSIHSLWLCLLPFDNYGSSRCARVFIVILYDYSVRLFLVTSPSSMCILLTLWLPPWLLCASISSNIAASMCILLTLWLPLLGHKYER